MIRNKRIAYIVYLLVFFISVSVMTVFFTIALISGNLDFRELAFKRMFIFAFPFQFCGLIFAMMTKKGLLQIYNPKIELYGQCLFIFTVAWFLFVAFQSSVVWSICTYLGLAAMSMIYIISSYMRLISNKK